MAGLTQKQMQQYQSDGFTILKGVFSKKECEDFIEQMMDLHSGRKCLEGFKPHGPDGCGRTHNQHLYDPRALNFLIDARLKQPLEDCFKDKVEGIQTMYFWKGTEQVRHQDQSPLPGCMSAWIPLIDVDLDNGTIWLQKGSHKGSLVLRETALLENGETDHPLRARLTQEIFEENDLSEIPAICSQGDVVLFSGRVIHRGGPIGKPSSFRHVLANHYIPYSFDEWPHVTWPRISFDGTRRFTDGKVAPE